MAGRGAPPAEVRASKKQRKLPNRELLVSDGVQRGWDLPEGVVRDRYGEPCEWNSVTVEWWESWRNSPQSTRMLSEPDWFFLLDTALMHHQMWSNGKWEFAAEIRLRVAKFGATPEDRLRLKQEIEAPTPDVGTKGGNNVMSLSERRRRITAE